MGRNNNKAPRRNLQAVAEDSSNPPDTLTSAQLIARVLKSMGSNLYLVETPTNVHMLTELAPKFRSTIWLRRGGYVVVDTNTFAERKNKIEGEIVNVVLGQKAWRKMSYW